MPIVEQYIDIAAPLETVFGFIADTPERQPEWWGQFELQERVTPPPTHLGSVSRYVYNMLGVTINGEHEVVGINRPEYLHVRTTSGIDSAFEFFFAPQDGGTRLTVRVDYKLPGSVIGQLLNRVVIEQKNESDLRDALDTLNNILTGA
ncbi:MAG: SRPBCC family protein [Anaerolineaceae bacterium]|nr:SRPBCC family protein [Anaerolineaceae bacterium]